ncbi:MAG: 3-hydroxybutyryl-CoA dehydrogenase [Rhodospirillaceae bacterium]|jgi:3-hydroxybutyryl-CoA dehydrogenase|nr:3-hydroxybutyryl-CoA dehydrogenase [Rhodospirillaceae bacterium]MBT4220248.1 3-hydroxybutyryl-CoA dehydrogenase [Rhodospirillaceae bacterium]MBT4464136.1 3-hydroxybutyryl-CoA dehydrogenase [Rhodospirillaceae bacterium]MBT5012863.1 3-hydroxybutyryl-CoA dehydrogenase [Rhodospirillaceae bacterium]MBT5307837.1 3-hydroxybutyryl-CoA dehydrogenase [Rhodospirillaceae bacterium]
MSSNINKIGIVGAGQMGCGIAHVCAIAGHEVQLMDIEQDRLDSGLQSIEKNMARQVKKEKLSQADMDKALKLVSAGTGYDGFKDCDLVIEAATENEELKKEIVRELCKVIPEHTIIASNTSSISITRLAAQSDRPNKFVGMHFMNPVPLMELVELIRGIATDEETYSAISELTTQLGKSPVNAEDFPAFIVNRILLPMINEAVYTLYEGVGSVEAIDSAMKLGTHHPMGPLELADFIGLDTCLAVMNVLHEGLADTKYRPCPLLVKYVEAGWLGRKTGRGFYDYSGDEPVPTR